MWLIDDLEKGKPIADQSLRLGLLVGRLVFPVVLPVGSDLIVVR